MRRNEILEYTRNCRAEGALLARIVFLCVIYVFLGFVTLYMTLLVGNFSAFIVCAVLSVSVIFITKPFFSEKRDYEIVDGSFRIYKVYGNAVSKKVFECELRSMQKIAPYRENTDISGVVKTNDYLSDGRSKDAYYAIYTQNGEKCAVIFDADQKFYDAAAFYNPRAFER
ncbi:MAG: hypothetical protein UHG68_09760 [Clostridia bacterium]|nr:hypothetical protein [Clostridia bacterium]